METPDDAPQMGINTTARDAEQDVKRKPKPEEMTRQTQASVESSPTVALAKKSDRATQPTIPCACICADGSLNLVAERSRSRCASSRPRAMIAGLRESAHLPAIIICARTRRAILLAHHRPEHLWRPRRQGVALSPHEREASNHAAAQSRPATAAAATRQAGRPAARDEADPGEAPQRGR